jgi:hypothetical protein
MLKAGRAYHQAKAKKNNWPKTRGVAMNPVRPHPILLVLDALTDRPNPRLITLTEEETTNISERPRPSPDTPFPDRRLVSLLPEGLVWCVLLICIVENRGLTEFGTAAAWIRQDQGLRRELVDGLWGRLRMQYVVFVASNGIVERRRGRSSACLSRSATVGRSRCLLCLGVSFVQHLRGLCRIPRVDSEQTRAGEYER